TATRPAVGRTARRTAASHRASPGCPGWPARFPARTRWARISPTSAQYLHMNISGLQAAQRGVQVAAGQGQGQLAVGGVLDAVDASGEDAVVHPGLAGHAAQ